MVQLIVIFINLVGLVLAFIWHPKWAWLLMAIVDFYIIFTYLIAKVRYKPRYIQELSEPANRLLREFGPYYMMPFASKDFSSTAATNQFAGILLAIVGIFTRYWYGLFFAAANWVIMGIISVSFSPVAHFSKKPELLEINDEIVKYIDSTRERI